MKVIKFSGILIIVSLLFNFVTAYLSQVKPSLSNIIMYTRVIFNFLINIFLVYVLVGFWAPMWLLFVLTPVAVAIYGNIKNTILISILVSSTLLSIYGIKGLSSLNGWAEAITNSIFIVMLSLFIHTLVTIIHRKND